MQTVIKQALTYLRPLANQLLDQTMWSYTLFGQVEPVAPDLERVVRAAQRFHQQLNELAEQVASEFPPLELDLSKTRHDLYTPLNQIIGYSEMLQEIAEETGYAGLVPALGELTATAREIVGVIGKNLVAPAPRPKPPAEATAPSVETAALPAEQVNAAPNLSTRQPNNILVVDDVETNRDILYRRLIREGYEVDNAENGQVALEKLRSGQFDLVLLDIMMPVMDGFETLQAMKADPHLAHIPVIMVSALAEKESFAKCIEMGAEDFLPKPVDALLLRARIRACLEKKRLHDLEILHVEELNRVTNQLREALGQVEQANQQIAKLNQRLEAENLRLNTELTLTQHEFELASQIQADFLPKSLPKLPGWELSAYFQPAHEVAGDFYDAFLLPNNRLGLVIADICDKGVGSALFMALTRSFIRVLSEQATLRLQSGLAVVTNPFMAEDVPLDVAHILQSVKLTNNYIALNHPESAIFATLFFGVLEPDTGTLYYVNAGHNAPYILSTQGTPGVKSRLYRTGPAVGSFANATYQLATLRLEPGDFLLAYTDGITEAQNLESNILGEQALHDLLTNVIKKERPPLNTTFLIDTILAAVRSHVGQAETLDDITLLILNSLPPSDNSNQVS